MYNATHDLFSFGDPCSIEAPVAVRGEEKMGRPDGFL